MDNNKDVNKNELQGTVDYYNYNSVDVVEVKPHNRPNRNALYD